MNRHESEAIREDLLFIRGRLERKAYLRDSSSAKSISKEEKLLRYIFTPVTAIARSEFLSIPEQLRILVGKIDGARDYVIKFGLPDEENEDEEDPKQVVKKDAFLAKASVNDTATPTSSKFRLLVIDEEANVDFSFNFPDEFSIAIGFDKKEENPDLKYFVNLPIINMTVEEHRIINYYLDGFSNAVTPKA